MREVLLAPERDAPGEPWRSGALASIQVARRLVGRELAYPREVDSGLNPVGNALHRACTVALNNLRDSMGDDGCNALVSRAIARNEALHPVLKQLRDGRESRISREKLAHAADANAAAAQAAVETLLATLIDILARLIGEDMAIRIIDRDAESDAPARDPSEESS